MATLSSAAASHQRDGMRRGGARQTTPQIAATRKRRAVFRSWQRRSLQRRVQNLLVSANPLSGASTPSNQPQGAAAGAQRFRIAGCRSLDLRHALVKNCALQNQQPTSDMREPGSNHQQRRIPDDHNKSARMPAHRYLSLTRFQPHNQRMATQKSAVDIRRRPCIKGGSERQQGAHLINTE